MKRHFYCCPSTAKVYEVQLFPRHAGNTATTIGVRDVGSDGRGPQYFLNRKLVGASAKDAIRRSKPDLVEQLKTCTATVDDEMHRIRCLAALLWQT